MRKALLIRGFGDHLVVIVEAVRLVQAVSSREQVRHPRQPREVVTRSRRTGGMLSLPYAPMGTNLAPASREGDDDVGSPRCHGDVTRRAIIHRTGRSGVAGDRR